MQDKVVSDRVKLINSKRYEELKREVNATIQDAVKKKANDVILAENTHMYYKINGVLTVEYDKDMWGEEHFVMFIHILGIIPEVILRDGDGEDALYEINFTKVDNYLAKRGNSVKLSVQLGKSTAGKAKKMRIVLWKAAGTSDIETDSNASSIYCVSIRLLPIEVASFEKLHLPEILSEITDNYNRRGLVLIAGDKENGKTTTGAALIRELNRDPELSRVIVTLEEPIEYAHKSESSLVLQREIGKHTETFERGVVDALMQGVDTIYIGELQNYATMSAMISAVDAGKNSLATVHATTIESILDRIAGEAEYAERDNMMSKLIEHTTMLIYQNLVVVSSGARLPKICMIRIKTEDVRSRIRNSSDKDKRTILKELLYSGDKSIAYTYEDNFNELLARGLVVEEDRELWED